MKVLFAVSTEDIAEKIIKDYQRDYKEIISSKNVYYFNAIIKELQRNQTYDRIVISEDLEPFTNNNYEAIDKFIFEKLDGISDEAIDRTGRDIPIVVICSERREKADNLLVKLFSIGVYDALVGNDRTIENVCTLLNKPRTKKEAKTYYRIEQGEYERENEKNVSEVEIQNILSHYRKLGKNEGRYVDSFNSIAEQYNDDQLKIIIKFLPMDVKAVLEAESPKYQSIMTYSPNTVKKQEQKKTTLNVSRIVDTHSKQPTGPVIIPSAMRKSDEVRKISDPFASKAGLDTVESETNAILEEIESIEGVAPIEQIQPIAPIESVQQINTIEPMQQIERIQPLEELRPIEPTRPTEPQKTVDTIETIEPINPIEQFESINSIENQVEQPVKRGRGRPRKIVVEPEQKVDMPKRGRGRPRKNPLPEVEQQEMMAKPVQLPQVEEAILPGFESEIQEPEIQPQPKIQPVPNFNNKNVSNVLPGFEDEEQYEDKTEEATLPGFEEEIPTQIPNLQTRPSVAIPQIQEEPISTQIPNTLNIANNFGQVNDNIVNNTDSINYNNYGNNNFSSTNKLQEVKDEDKEVDISYLLTQDKKIVSFVGTSKNGVSFLVNNIADILSNNGIKTAIVDLTNNKNSYYIYTENREELREIAYASMENLKRGEPIGIEVNKNLTVYTSSPNIRNTGYSIESMLTTLVKNYSLVLLDCDYSTNKEYFRVAQEIYMVQSMDVLTIQPLTEFLRKLKLSNILQPEKLRAVINKAQRIRGLNEEMIVGGMSTYNDPEMSIQDRLFDMKTISKTVIPFDIDAYSIYLSGIANCEISTRGYNKVFMTCLNKLADQVYPLISGATLKRKNRESVNNRNYMNYKQNGTTFTNDMSNTLDQMKRQYK